MIRLVFSLEISVLWIYFSFLLENHSYLKISGKPVSELGGIALIYVGVRHNRFMSIMCMVSQFFTDLCKIIMKTP